jgi:hypothetical protein
METNEEGLDIIYRGSDQPKYPVNMKDTPIKTVILRIPEGFLEEFDQNTKGEEGQRTRNKQIILAMHYYLVVVKEKNKREY